MVDFAPIRLAQAPSLAEYFDTIPHRDLLQSVARRVADGKILRLLKDVRISRIHALRGLTPRQAEVQFGAVAIGAVDIRSGRVAVGASQGGVPANLHDDLKVLVDKITPGLCKNVPGKCAEIKAANELLQKGARIEDIRFSTPLRPRSLGPQEVCLNCQQVFDRRQFAPGTDFD